MILADLHLHSRYSDGSDSFQELFQLCRERGVTHVAVVDHDTIQGQAAAAQEAHAAGLGFITGIEISAKDSVSGRKVHILGYGFPLPSPRLEEAVRPIRLARDTMTRRQIGILEKLGYPVSIAEVEEEAGPETVLYKQHIMAVLVRKGVADSLYGNTYIQLFKGKSPCAGEIDYIDAAEAVRAVRESGGFPVLAHPGQGQVQDLLPFLKQAGLAGVEIDHPSNGLVLQSELREKAQRLKLVCTGGSDFHGSYGDEPPPGTHTAPDAAELLRWCESTMGKHGIYTKATSISNEVLVESW